MILTKQCFPAHSNMSLLLNAFSLELDCDKSLPITPNHPQSLPFTPNHSQSLPITPNQTRQTECLFAHMTDIQLFQGHSSNLAFAHMTGIKLFKGHSSNLAFAHMTGIKLFKVHSSNLADAFCYLPNSPPKFIV